MRRSCAGTHWLQHAIDILQYVQLLRTLAPEHILQDKRAGDTSMRCFSQSCATRIAASQRNNCRDACSISAQAPCSTTLQQPPSCCSVKHMANILLSSPLLLAGAHCQLWGHLLTPSVPTQDTKMSCKQLSLLLMHCSVFAAGMASTWLVDSLPVLTCTCTCRTELRHSQTGRMYACLVHATSGKLAAAA